MTQPDQPGAVEHALNARGQLCPHFGDCGGCETQNLEYAEQIARKQRRLEQVFSEFWTRPIPVLPSPRIWHYRNKVDFNFGLRHYPEPPAPGFERETVLGFTRKGEWYNPLEVETCLIAPAGCDALLRAVRAWARSAGLRAYDSRAKTGLLRTLLVREGKRTGERMVGLITSEGECDERGFSESIAGSFPAHSVFRGTLFRSARGAFADRVEFIDGNPHILETLRIPDGGASRALTFRISPFSFFQTNTFAAETLYAEIRSWVRASTAAVLYDLYGGAGCVALACSDLVELVRSVESEDAATRDGEVNARLNGIDNVFFTTQTARQYLRVLAESGGMEPNAVAVVDPPRAGLTPKPLRRLLDCRPARILYVSCNPAVLKDELPALLRAYKLDRLWAVDMFPHTPHVEVLASLVRT